MNEASSNATFTVVRRGGSFGAVSVMWRLERLLPVGEAPQNDVEESAGTVFFKDKEVAKALTILIKVS